MNLTPEINDMFSGRRAELRNALGVLGSLLGEAPRTPQENYRAAVEVLRPSAEQVAQGQVSDPNLDSARAAVDAAHAQYQIDPAQVQFKSGGNPLLN